MFLFLEMLRMSHGQYSDKQVNRIGHMSGPLGKMVESIYEGQVAETRTAKAKSRWFVNKPYVSKFVNDFKNARLFDNIPRRRHWHFPNFKHQVSTRNPSSLQANLRNYSQTLDAERYVLPI